MPKERKAELTGRVAGLPMSDLSTRFLRIVRERITTNLGQDAAAQWMADLPPAKAEWLRGMDK